jgi:hypothetical protein
MSARMTSPAMVVPEALPTPLDLSKVISKADTRHRAAGAGLSSIRLMNCRTGWPRTVGSRRSSAISARGLELRPSSPDCCRLDLDRRPPHCSTIGPTKSVQAPLCLARLSPNRTAVICPQGKRSSMLCPRLQRAADRNS